VVAGERHLARADEVQVVGLELVDLVGVLPEEAGAAHDLGPHERRGIMGMNPASTARWSASDMSAYSRRADAGEEVEAAARDLGAALHVDRAELLAEGEVVERLEVEGCRFAVRTDGDEVLLAAGRNAVDDDVLDAREGRVGRLFGGGDGLLRRLDAVAELLGLRDERGLVLLGRGGDGLAVGVLRGAQLLEGGDRGASCAVGLDRGVDRVGRLAAGLLRALDEVRLSRSRARSITRQV
jgi:hypothetical protein